MTTAISQAFISAANFRKGRDGQPLLAIVNHLMLGTQGSTLRAFRQAGFGASAHFGLAEDGTILQFVPDADTAFAQGNLREAQMWIPWLRRCVEEGINPNSVALSIEWAGRHEGGRWVWKTWKSPRGELVQKQVLVDITRPWHPTTKQYLAGLELIRSKVAQYNLPPDRLHICRHSDVDSVMKAFCPGPGFPMEQLLKDLNR